MTQRRLSLFGATGSVGQSTLDLVRRDGEAWRVTVLTANSDVAELAKLVDDLADTGVTLSAVVDRLRGMPSISELRSAVIWTKGVSSYLPDYHVELLPTSPWIHQPFEEYDGMCPDVLAKKFAI